MKRRSSIWRRARDLDAVRRQLPNRHVRRFRSDNDLHQWRMFCSLAIPMTIMTLGFLKSAGLPFRYSPVALLPALSLLMFLRYQVRRDRKSGRRFSSYDTEDLG